MAARFFRAPSIVRWWLPAAAAVLGLAASAAPGFAAAPTVLADVGRFTSVAVGAMPGDGYLLVWQDADLGLQARRISAAGFPSGPAKTVLDLSGQVFAPSVAVAASGAWAVFYGENVEADQIGLGAAFFDARDRLLRRVSYPDPIPDPGGLAISVAPHAVALPAGGFAVAFTVGVQEDPLGDPIRPTDSDAWVMRVGADGETIGAPVRVNETTAGFQRTAGFGLSAAGAVVSWTSSGDAAVDLRARVLGPDLAPLSGEIQLNGSPVFGATGLAVGSDGRFVAAWTTLEEPRTSVRVRAFAAGGSPLGGESEAGPGGALSQGSPDAAITRSGVVWVSWGASGAPPPPDEPASAEIVVRPFDLDARPLAAPLAVATTRGGAAFLTGGESGALAAWRPETESPLLVGLLAGQAAGAGTPPAELALASPEVPGFRVWVRLSPRPAELFWGTRTEPCLAEALCVAGALPDRAEVIVRVAGPKPNGFLWPTLVKLSTSQAEVWLQQESTGDVQYYLLPGASPGSGLLPGLFDRTGFKP